MTSVNTNASATTALRTLQATNKALETTQNRVSTGLKIGEAKDNAAYWAISTTLKSDNKSLATVKDALGLGAATVDVAYQGLNKAKDVLDEIKSKLTAATQAGVDRNIIQAEISALKDQLNSIASSSTFSGENWLSINSAVAGYNQNKSIVASFSRDAANAVSIGTIGVDISTVALFDTGATGTGIVDAAKQLKAADGTNLAYGGVSTTAGTTGTGSINAAGFAAKTENAGKASNAGTTAYTPANAATTLTFDHETDVLSFKVSVDGGGLKDVFIRRGTVQQALNDTSNAIQITSTADLVKVTQLALADAGVTGVTVGVNAAGALNFTSTASLPATLPAARGVAITLAAFSNTAGETTSALTATDINTGATTYEPASAKLGAFSGPITFTGDAQINFSLKVDGAATATNYTINKAAVSAALGTTDGKVSTASELQQVIISVIETEATYTVGFAAGDDLLVGALSDGSLTFTSRGTTATSEISVALATGKTAFFTQDTAAPTVTTGGSSTISVADIDITDASLKARLATTDGTSTGAIDGAKVAAVLTAYISVVNDAITKITSAASSLGAVSSRIELQNTFVDTLTDTIDKGVGDLIDADLSEESTRLQALQTKQQLGVQALSIANTSTQNILALFRG